MSRRVTPPDLTIQSIELLLCDDVRRAANLYHLRFLEVGCEVLNFSNDGSLSLLVNARMPFRIFGVKPGEIVCKDVMTEMKISQVPSHHDGGSECLVAETNQGFVEEVAFCRVRNLAR